MREKNNNRTFMEDIVSQPLRRDQRVNMAQSDPECVRSVTRKLTQRKCTSGCIELSLVACFFIINPCI